MQRASAAGTGTPELFSKLPTKPFTKASTSGSDLALAGPAAAVARTERVRAAVRATASGRERDRRIPQCSRESGPDADDARPSGAGITQSGLVGDGYGQTRCLQPLANDALYETPPGAYSSPPLLALRIVSIFMMWLAEYGMRFVGST